MHMNHTRSEAELAWEEVSFWQDYVTRCKAEQGSLPEPRVMEALENAWRRYERALLDTKKPTTL